MFDSGSRYAVLEDAIYTTPDGREITYKRRRFLPLGETLAALTAVQMGPGDRLDRMAAQFLGDPEQFWQICDANNCMNPFDLGTTGDTLRIPIPQGAQAL
jgi:hypothetical protein